MLDMIETRNETTWILPTQRVETPYAVSWQGAKGKLFTGRVVGVRGDCYDVEVITHKATYAARVTDSVRMVDALPAIGGAAVWLDVDAMLWARWDDFSEGRDLRERLEDFEFDLNGVGGWRHE